ncbi:NUDIX domain-containing protein [Neorhizobium lilium]|uniref:NUDIX domain-containing protein n=1 Tax=Neorhizobium lilium TaxID=2503024 RepID=A0A3S3TTN7_9HYPH|nr:NUDIX domain-containing protein [Neorhizobium lilium]RWX74458.1 NUDIX domain-containing protein [Neorhizobium lilium]
MAAKRSAGLLIFRRVEQDLQVLLVHPGGPFWARRDEAAWSIPKGLVEEGEDELEAARREVQEETGILIDGECQWLGEYRQPGGKRVLAWCVEDGADIDATRIVSNSFTMEYPPKSGRMQEFPEVDKAGWFNLGPAAVKILKGQKPMLDDLQDLLG